MNELVLRGRLDSLSLPRKRLRLWAVTGTMLVIYEKSLSGKEAKSERYRQSKRKNCILITSFEPLV